MTPAPCHGGPNAVLDEVVATMAEHRYGSAVVVDNNHVVGVFSPPSTRWWPSPTCSTARLAK